MEIRVFFSRRSSLIFGLLTLLPLVRPQTRSIKNLMAHYDCGTVSNDSVTQPPPSVLRWTVSSIPCAILCLNAISGNCASFSWKASTRMCTLHSTETSRCSFSPGTQLAVTNPQSTSSTVQTSPSVVTTIRPSINTTLLGLTNTTVGVTFVQGPANRPPPPTNIPVLTTTTVAQPSPLVTVGTVQDVTSTTVAITSIQGPAYPTFPITNITVLTSTTVVQPSPLVTAATVQDVASTSVFTTVQDLTSTTALPIFVVNVTTNNASSSCPGIVCFENSRLSTNISITTASIQNCYDRCAAETICTGFSYYNGNSACTMYSSVMQVPVNDSGYETCYCKKNIVQNQTYTPSCVSGNSNVISGEYKMTTASPTGSKCFVCKCNYVFYMGNNNGVFFIPAAIPDFDTCRSFCSDSSSCYGFAYKEQDRSCQLTPISVGTATASQAIYCTSC